MPNSKSSTQFAINFPNPLVSACDQFFARKKFREFVREAVVEKLERDFGVKLEKAIVCPGRGARVDLANASAGTLEKMRKQAAVARAGKKRKSCKKLPEIDPLPSPHRQDSNIKSGVRSRIA